MSMILLSLSVAGCASVDRTSHEMPAQAPAFVEPEQRIVAAPETRPVEPLLQGEGPIDLSIEQAIVLSLRQNRDLAVEQLAPLITATQEDVERGQFDPQLSLLAQRDKASSVESSRASGQQFSVDSSADTLSAGITQQLPTGTRIDVAISQMRESSNRTPEQQQARLGLSVTQSLLQGFGSEVNLARVRQARLGTVASSYELRGYIEALLAQLETAYWQYVLASDEIAIYESSLALARQQRDQLQKEIDAGVFPRIEAAAAEAEVARREQALINSRSRLEETRLRLLRIINPGNDGSLSRALTASTPPQVAPVDIDNLDERLGLALQKRPDLAEAYLRLEQGRLETIVTQNGLMPRLDAFIALGKTGYAQSFSNSFRDIDGDSYDLSAGVSFSYWLGNRANRARDRAAMYSQQQSEAAVENLKQLIELDVRLALNEVERSRQQITASATTRNFQQQAAEAEQQRFAVGSSTTLQVAQAQRDLLEAQIAEIEAVINYRIALVNLYQQEGSLLERRGILLTGQ